MRGAVAVLVALGSVAGVAFEAGAQTTGEVVETFTVTPIVLASAFAPYAHALAALAGWALLMLVITIVSVARQPRERTPSGHPVRDYADPGYRASRALANAMEATGPFLAATVAAILAGAPSFWVNLLASVFLVARVATFVVHVWTENQPARSATWAVAVLCLLGLAGLALVSAFMG